jgi:creatinine amidohydrolase
MIRTRLIDMTSPETAERFHLVDTLILPCASVETQGPHMPVSQDIIVGEEVARRVGEKTGAAVAPTIPYGTSSAILDFAGTVSIRSNILGEFYKDVCRSYHRQGVNKFLLLNTHYYNTWPINITIDELRNEGMFAIGANFWELAERLCKDVAESDYYPFGHAGEITTSVVMSIRPDLVDLSKARKEAPTESFQLKHIKEVPSVYAFDDYKKIAQKGMYGDPRKATTEKGEIVLKRCVESLASLIEELKAMDLKEP